MKRIILLGAPGAGKGTQADAIEEKLGFKKISTGDLIRAEAAAKTEIGLKMHALISKGELVSDETIIAILKQRLQKGDIADGYIMDGFPRTKHQAEELSGMPVENEIALYLKVGKPDVIVKRLVARLTCPECDAIYNLENSPPKVEGKCDMCNGNLRQRSDDNEETVLRRLNIYRRETKPVIEYYRQKGVLTVIDATANINDVYMQIANVLKGEVN